MIALDVMLWAGVFVCGIPVVVLCLQLGTAWLLVDANSTVLAGLEQNEEVPQTVIVMPAHNEEKVIAETLICLHGLSPKIQVLVVADNCTDQTASIAKDAGARVVERTSAELRGKGYALQFGLNQLRELPPEVVIVLDSDCSTTPLDMHRLSLACVRVSGAVQGIYLMHAPVGGSISSKVAEFAWLVKTKIRPMGWRPWGGTSQLMGSGFALPWSVAASLDLASGHIVEDMKLTLELAQSKQAPVFVTDSQVSSVFPTGESAQATQRRRWEHGHLSMVLTSVPRALLQGFATLNFQLVSVALDFLVPPLSLLVLMIVFLLLLAVGQVVVFSVSLPAVLIFCMASALLLSVSMVWAKWGQEVLTARELLSVPTFILRKMGLYVGFLKRRERNWTRTDRD